MSACARKLASVRIRMGAPSDFIEEVIYVDGHAAAPGKCTLVNGPQFLDYRVEIAGLHGG
jgi:hypothetical protein